MRLKTHFRRGALYTQVLHGVSRELLDSMGADFEPQERYRCERSRDVVVVSVDVVVGVGRSGGVSGVTESDSCERIE